MDHEKIEIDQPLWDQSTYIGRWKHYAFISDSRIIFEPRKRLLEAKQFCEDYKNGKVPPSTTKKDVIYAKKLRDSSFHPDDGQLMFNLGRMCFQLPANVLLTTAMLTFYKSTTSIVVCQTINQTYNALLNYTNRNALSDENAEEKKNSTRTAFFCAVITSSIVAVTCRKLLARRGPTIERCVPFFAVVAGQMTNLPLMRKREISKGTPLFTEGAQEPFMTSRVAAVKGISECLITRIATGVPCMFFTPIISQSIKAYCFYQRRQWIIYPLEVAFCVIGCLFAIPSALAIFPRYNSMNPEWLRLYGPEYKEFQQKVEENVDKIYYYKGL